MRVTKRYTPRQLYGGTEELLANLAALIRLFAKAPIYYL